MGILLAIHVLVTIFLILIVLIQKTEGGSSLFASGGSGNLFNAQYVNKNNVGFGFGIFDQLCGNGSYRFFAYQECSDYNR